jgi:hypothetical protein
VRVGFAERGLAALINEIDVGPRASTMCKLGGRAAEVAHAGGATCVEQPANVGWALGGIRRRLGGDEQIHPIPRHRSASATLRQVAAPG